MFLLLKRNNNFEDNKVWKKRKKIPPPLPPQKWPCLRKNYKKLRFSNFRPKKHQLGANQYSKISCSWFLANQMRITKLFSKLRLVQNWPFDISYTSLCSNATQHWHYVSSSVINDIFFCKRRCAETPLAVNASFVKKNTVLIAKKTYNCKWQLFFLHN